MSPLLLQFGAFKLDKSRQRVVGPGGTLEFRPKTFEVLRYLVENAGRVALKEELMSAVWPNLTVTDESLTRCVSEIRQGLGRDAHTMIKTVPKRGYMLEVPVSAHLLDEQLPTGQPTESMSAVQAEDASRLGEAADA